MIDLISEASTLGALLEETRGVVGVVLGGTDGELRTVVGSFLDGDATAAAAATLTEELTRIGAMLGLGELGVASLRAPSANRVFAQQDGAVLAIELDPKRPLGDLEAKLQAVRWAPEDAAVNRVPTVSLDDRATGRAVAAEPAPRSSGPIAPPIGELTPVVLPATLAAAARAPSPDPTAVGTPQRMAASTRPPPIPPRAVRSTRPPPPGAPQRQTPYPVPAPVPMKSVGSGPVFTGDLEEFCLPDLLEFLRNSHRTGLLVCTTAAGVGKIQLSRGMIIGAESPHALDLREHFLTSPAVAPERRRVLAALPAECFGDDVIDGVLVARALVPRDEVEQARVARIYSAFREMMRWTVGRFSFDPGVAVVTNPALALSAQSILMHIYQEQDEHGR